MHVFPVFNTAGRPSSSVRTLVDARDQATDVVAVFGQPQADIAALPVTTAGYGSHR